MNKILQLQYQEKIFYLKILETNFSLYLEMFLDIEDKTYREKFIYYNLATSIIKYLQNKLPGLSMIGIIDFDPIIEEYNNFNLNLELNEVFTNIEICLYGEDVTQIIGLYYAQKLQLERISPEFSVYESAVNNYQLKLIHKHLATFSQEKLIRCELKYQNQIEVIYFRSSLANIIYGKHYPHYVPFQADHYSITAVNNLINLWIRNKLKLSDLTLISSKITLMPIATYSVLVIEDMAEQIFFKYRSSMLGALINNNVLTEKVAAKTITQESILLLENKINMPAEVFSFHLTLQQLQQVKVNDIILLPELKENNFNVVTTPYAALT